MDDSMDHPMNPVGIPILRSPYVYMGWASLPGKLIATCFKNAHILKIKNDILIVNKL